MVNNYDKDQAFKVANADSDQRENVVKAPAITAAVVNLLDEKIFLVVGMKMDSVREDITDFENSKVSCWKVNNRNTCYYAWCNTVKTKLLTAWCC